MSRFEEDSAKPAIVIDTKWKTPDHQVGPSDEDLRQIYAYLHYFNANEGILLYPGTVNQAESGYYKQNEGLHCRQVFRQIIKDGRAKLNIEDLVKGKSG